MAYYSVLLFNILDVSRFEAVPLPEKLPEETNQLIHNLVDVSKALTSKNLQECFHDAIYYRDELRQLFKHGEITLRERAVAESIFWHVVNNISKEVKKLKYVPDEFEMLEHGAVRHLLWELQRVSVAARRLGDQPPLSGDADP